MTTWYAQAIGAHLSETDRWNSIPSGTGEFLDIDAGGLGINDIICANGKTSLIIDRDVTCARISNGFEGTGIVNGNFFVQEDHTLNCDIKTGSATCLILSSSEIPFTVTINGTIYGATSGSSVYAVHQGIRASVVINGNIIGTTSMPSFSSHSVYINNPIGTAIITGNIIGGSGSSCTGVYVYATGATTIYGNITGGQMSAGVWIAATGPCTIRNGTISGGTMATAYGINLNTGAACYCQNTNFITTAAPFAHGAVLNTDGCNSSNFVGIGNSVFGFRLAPTEVLKGVNHAGLVGTLAAASPFRRLNRLV
ncbi:MAG: hypothetical protein A2Y10_18095 [Planctomycetes bacterium GWF2_41_51]|nr:MAG: hypothetical protein A2Y10_18095 [Planctomycetes bacterium GWF2_41_51]